jgi:hypothetical protein
MALASTSPEGGQQQQGALRFPTSHECENDDHVRWAALAVKTHAHRPRLGQLSDAELTFGCWPDALQIGDSGVGKSCLLLRFAVR